MLIGGDDISNDVITIGTCFSILFTFALVSALADWRKSDSSVDGEPQGNWRWDANCKLSFFYPPHRQSAPKSCSQAINIRVRFICFLVNFSILG